MTAIPTFSGKCPLWTSSGYAPTGMATPGNLAMLTLQTLSASEPQSDRRLLHLKRQSPRGSWPEVRASLRRRTVKLSGAGCFKEKANKSTRISWRSGISGTATNRACKRSFICPHLSLRPSVSAATDLPRTTRSLRGRLRRHQLLERREIDRRWGCRVVWSDGAAPLQLQAIQHDPAQIL